MVELNIYSFGGSAPLVGTLLDSAVNECVVTDYIRTSYEPKDCHWSIELQNDEQKRILVDYIYTWLPTSVRSNVRFFDKPIHNFPLLDAYNYMMSKWQ